MPVYIAKFDTCDCCPLPDMAFRADNMVSAVMLCQDTLNSITSKAQDSRVDLHGEITIEAIEEVSFELMDETGISEVVEFWKEVLVK